MKYIYILLFFFIGCSTKTNKHEFGIVIHGGAGTISKENMSKDLEKAYKNALEESVMIGYEILKNGGTSQDAVEKTINFLEDSPLFNAGKGAVLNYDGEVELDASFMEGKNLNALIFLDFLNELKNPISAAIKVMNSSQHVMLSGNGADSFAEELGMELEEQEYFKTERRVKSLNRVKTIESNKTSSVLEQNYLSEKYGTVGCVALDQYGNLSAGTSTGGMTNKKWNRIGDAPIIGAGTYANNDNCAVSSTGWENTLFEALLLMILQHLWIIKIIQLKRLQELLLIKLNLWVETEE